MKRGFLTITLAILAVLCLAFGFVGCGENSSDNTGNTGNGGTQTEQPGGGQGGTQEPDGGGQGGTQKPAPHDHSYGDWKVTKEATCKAEGAKERECACGEKETAAIPRVGHDFEDMTCKVCGTKASLGLEYTLINDEKEYAVSGIGDCTDAELIITNNYNRKPVTAIGAYAFELCSGLTSVIIPDSVTSIGYGAFGGCTGLTSIEFPDSVTMIGDRAFDGCNGLTSIEIPDSVTMIGDRSFEFCSGLTSVIIPDSVTLIGDSAFCYCSGLTSVNLIYGQ